MVSRPAGLSTTTTASSSNRILIRSITSMLHQINRPALHFLENHSDINTEDTLENHRNRACDGQDENQRTPTGHEPLPASANPEIRDVSKLEYSERDEDGTEQQPDP